MYTSRSTQQVTYAFFHLLLLYLVPTAIIGADFWIGDQLRAGQVTGWSCALGVLGIIIAIAIIAAYWWLVLILLIGAAYELIRSSNGIILVPLFVGVAVLYSMAQYIKRTPVREADEARQIVWKAVQIPWYLSIAVPVIVLFTGLPRTVSIALASLGLVISIILAGRALFAPQRSSLLRRSVAPEPVFSDKARYLGGHPLLPEAMEVSLSLKEDVLIVGTPDGGTSIKFADMDAIRVEADASSNQSLVVQFVDRLGERNTVRFSDFRVWPLEQWRSHLAAARYKAKTHDELIDSFASHADQT